MALDISGSMAGPLTHRYDKEITKTRLDLSKDAIWMFYNKLNAEDIFSLIVFHN